ncbi:hypothetical protein [Anabaenopsis elenkinii]|uniref:Uncharacterized protein n=1 Tax=Anabaenopsis elenkinii CCIBt3563 TaxID=2779889 RepID=A0A7S6REY4_9CYAN|nr:hypothetical protein [Anabaenopsis elenkinii]QOV23583.1 hypothetical protein IM676_04570 [Anabaenopsis elenkinii CCIBt3563]
MLGNFQRSRLIFLAVFTSFLVTVSAFTPVMGNAQSPRLLRPGVTNIQLKDATSRLSELEQALNQVENKKVATLQDTEKVEKAALAYAEAMKTALDNALKEAETLATSQGKQGSISPLETFEKAETANRQRLEKIGDRANTIEKQIQVGTIRLDKSLIQDLSVVERGELLESLQPPARQLYLREQPELFKPVLERPGINNPVLERPQNQLKFLEETFNNLQSFVPTNANYHIGIVVSQMIQGVSNMLVPPAYAIAAAPCVGLALTKNWPAVAACVARAGSEATSIYNQFVSCWRNARNPLRWLKRTGCVARLIARLA